MNKAFMVGNVCADPALTETSNGTQICRFSVAVTRSYKSPKGEILTDFIPCVAWKGVAETIGRYVHKGDKLALVGSIEINNYMDREGNQKTSFSLVVSDVEFLGKRKGANSPQNKPNNKSSVVLEEYDEDDTDIPF